MRQRRIKTTEGKASSQGLGKTVLIATLPLFWLLSGCSIQGSSTMSKVENLDSGADFSDHGWQGKATVATTYDLVAEWDASRKYDSVEVEVYEGSSCNTLVLTVMGLNPSARQFTFTSGQQGKVYTFKVLGRRGGRTFPTDCSGSVTVNVAASCTGSRLSNSPYGNSGETSVDGSSVNPYLICTATQLSSLTANTADWGKHFVQGADINISSVTGSIGSSATPFSGSYNGANFELSNYVINNSTRDDAGLFGVISSTAVIRDLRLNNFSINARHRVGTLVGDVAGATIQRVTVSNSSVTVRGDNGGGVIGRQVQGLIDDVETVSVNLTQPSLTSNIGGIVGLADGGPAYITISNSFSSGTISGVYMRLGGICGTCNVTMNNTTSAVSITGTNTTNAGGLAGEFSGTMYRSGATGNISGGNNVGGVAGQFWSGTIHRSYYNGTSVTAHAANGTAGGLTGSLYNGINIYNNWVTAGSVTSNHATNGRAAGLTGGHSTGNCAISNNYTVVTTISGTGSVGGLTAVDDNGSGSTRCTYRGNIWNNLPGLTRSVGSHAGAITGITSSNTTDMQLAATYTPFAWNALIWNIVDGAYPTIIPE